MDPSARSQYRAISYRQISARIGLAVAKASVMRLLGIPRLPPPSSVPRSLLARNCPGLADSFSPPVPLTSPFLGVSLLPRKEHGHVTDFVTEIHYPVLI